MCWLLKETFRFRHQNRKYWKKIFWLLSADNLCKLIWAQIVWHYYFLIVPERIFLTQLLFKTKSQLLTNKHKKLPSMQRVKNTHYIIWWEIWKLIKSLSAGPNYSDGKTCANKIVPDKQPNQGLFVSIFSKLFIDKWNNLVLIINWKIPLERVRTLPIC